MSDSKRTYNLPVSTRRRDAIVEVPAAEVLPPCQEQGLTEQQTDLIVQAGAAAVSDAMTIAKTLVTGYIEIKKIREQSSADIAKIEAETRRVEVEMAGEVKKLVAKTDALRTRGQIAVDLVRAINDQISRIPDADNAARRAAIDNLPQLVGQALELEDRT